MRVSIEAIAGPGQGNRIPIGQNQVLTVGRTEWSDICIPNDPQISGKHFQIENTGVEVRLADLNSTNGTMVNGQFVKQAHLNAGDQVVAGSTTFVVYIERSTVAPDGRDLAAGQSAAHGPHTPFPTSSPAPSPVHSPFPGGAPTGGSPFPASTPAHPTMPAGGAPVAAAGGFQSPIFIPPQYEAPPAPAHTPAPTTPAPVPPASLQPAAAAGQTPFATPIQFDSGVATSPGQRGSPFPPNSGAHPPEPPQGESSRDVPGGAPGARPEPRAQVVLDERRQMVRGDARNARQFQLKTFDNGFVLAEGPPPANPKQPGATAVAVQLAQVGPLLLIAHFAKASQPVPQDIAGKPLYHWLPPEPAREFGPLVVQPASDNAHLQYLDALWGEDSILAVCGREAAKLEEHLFDLIQYNPNGIRRNTAMFGYCWPSGILQICRSAQPHVIADLFEDVVHFVFCESDQEPGAWCIGGRAGLESILEQLGFQQLPAPATT